jgi:microcin C transport system substrate-binding protein
MRILGLFAAALAAGFLVVGQASAQGVTRTHGHTLVGKLQYGPDFEHWRYVNPNAPKGGDVVQFTIGDFDSFHPFILEGRPGAGLGLMYESLFTSNLDELSAHYGLLAEWMEYPDDLSWVTFKIRDEARWHDGVPVSVDDIIWSLEILKTEGHPYYGQYFKNLARAEDLGGNQVRIYFETEDLNRELPHIAGQLPVLPKHYWESRNFAESTLDPPLGSGPYRIKDFDAPSSITYELVPDYWGKDLPANVGLNNFGTIRIDYYLDQTIALEAFKAGEYDFRSENNSKMWAVDYESPGLRDGLIVKRLIPNDSPAGMQGFFINIRQPQFQDRAVREALQYVFDFEWTNSTLFYGQYTRTRSYFENSELAATGMPGPAELAYLEPHRAALPPELFTQEYNPPVTQGDGNLRAMLQEAQTRLAEAGWTVEDGRLVDANGEQMRIEFLLISPSFERIVGPVVQNMERLGIDSSQRTVETAQYQERVETFDFDVIVSTRRQSLSPGNEQRDFWGCESAQTEGGGNIIGICDPVVEDLIEQIIAAPDRESLIAVSKAMDRVLQWGYYVIPNWHINSFRVAYWDTFGQPEATPRYGVGTSTWWVDPERVERIRSGKAALGD